MLSLFFSLKPASDQNYDNLSLSMLIGLLMQSTLKCSWEFCIFLRDFTTKVYAQFGGRGGKQRENGKEENLIVIVDLVNWNLISTCSHLLRPA